MSQTLTDHPDPLRRESAALVLGNSGNQAAVPLLVQRLEKDENRWVRARCGEALGLLGDPNAVDPLRKALDREKSDRVRRAIAGALLRLGARQGLLELMWQLKSGNQHTKAEVMKFLVRLTAQPLGQDETAWWHYFNTQGSGLLRPGAGSRPGMIQLAGPPRLAGQQPPGHPRALGPIGAWRQACAVRVRLSPGGGLITLATLQRYEREHGSLPNGCVLLLDAQWTKDGDAGPGIALDAAQYLLQQAPALQGVGLNAPRLDAPNAGAEPVKNLLLSKGLIVVEALGNLRRLPTDRFWLLVLASPGCGTTTRPTGASGNLLLAILPR